MTVGFSLVEQTTLPQELRREMWYFSSLKVKSKHSDNWSKWDNLKTREVLETNRRRLDMVKEALCLSGCEMCPSKWAVSDVNYAAEVSNARAFHFSLTFMLFWGRRLQAQFIREEEGVSSLSSVVKMLRIFVLVLFFLLVLFMKVFHFN